ncbi:MAG: stage III sporulation protein AF [Clostridia bacterium]|nr:stage III sporulation protein AF [Clostridia bacterium]
MNTLRVWAISLSSACIFCGIVSYLKPQLHFQKVLKLSLCAFLIVVLLTPLSGKNKLDIASIFSGELSVADQEKEGEQYLLTQQLNAAAEAIKKEISNLLEQKKLDFRQIQVSMNIDKQTNISINEITIEGVPEAQRQKVHDVLKKEYELEAAVS